MTFLQSDGTTFTFVGDSGATVEGKLFPDMPSFHELNSLPPRPGCDSAAGVARKKEKQRMKTTQSDALIACALREKYSGVVDLIFFPLFCPLQFSDKETTETSKVFAEESLYIDGADRFFSLFPHVYDLTCNDGGSNNIKLERLLTKLNLRPRWRSPCEAHLLSTIQGRSFACLESELSGLVNLALVMGGSGETAKLRECLRWHLRKLVKHQKSFPPPDNDPRIVARDSLFALVFARRDRTASMLKRISSLKALLHSDLSNRQDIWFYSVAENVDLDVWAAQVSSLLLPTNLNIIDRRRWLNEQTLTPVRECALLANIHGIFEPSVSMWLTGKKREGLCVSICELFLIIFDVGSDSSSSSS